MGKVKRPNIHKVIRDARRLRLFVLLLGDGDSFKLEFTSKDTGKWVLSFYPEKQFWAAAGGAKGSAKDYREALSNLPAWRAAIKAQDARQAAKQARQGPNAPAGG